MTGVLTLLELCAAISEVHRPQLREMLICRLVEALELFFTSGALIANEDRAKLVLAFRRLQQTCSSECASDQDSHSHWENKDGSAAPISLLLPDGKKCFGE